MDQNNQLPDFLQELAAGSQSSGRFSRDVKVINAVSWDNHGKYYLIPISGVNGESPIRQLNKIYELDKQVSGVTREGKPYTRTEKLRFFSNPSYYGQLNEAQMARYDRIKSKCVALTEAGWKGIAVRDYTLLQGFIVEHKNDNKIVNEKCVAVIVIRSKNFTRQLNEAFKNNNDKLGTQWIAQLCNNDVIRKRFMEFTLKFVSGGGGYECSVQFGKFDEDMYRYTSNKDEYDLSAYKEVIEQLGDPINKFIDIPVLRDNNGHKESVPVWDEAYLDKLEGHLNECLRVNQGQDGPSETPVAAVQPDTYTQQPSAPSASPTEVPAQTPAAGAVPTTDMTPNPPTETPAAAPADDLPF